MASTRTSTSGDGRPIIEGLLAKRAQGRHKIGRLNWKTRYFVLHPGELSYWTKPGGKYNADSECKGVIRTADIHAVEEVAPNAFSRKFMLQIVHSSVLYIQCINAEERDRWLQCLRLQCRTNAILHPRYHPGCFDGHKWTCCDVPSKDHKGCEKAFDYRAMKVGDKENAESASGSHDKPHIAGVNEKKRTRTNSLPSIRRKASKGDLHQDVAEAFNAELNTPAQVDGHHPRKTPPRTSNPARPGIPARAFKSSSMENVLSGRRKQPVVVVPDKVSFV